MQEALPAYLASTYQLLQCAFPHGIDECEYLPLLALLYEHMSDRSLARVIADYTEKDYYIVLNDIYRIGATKANSFDVVESVKQKLINCEYEKWLADE